MSIQLDWKSLYTVHTLTLEQLLVNYQNTFAEGKLKGHEAKINVNAEVQPCFRKARSIPYAIRNIVEAEPDQLEREGIIYRAHSVR